MEDQDTYIINFQDLFFRKFGCNIIMRITKLDFYFFREQGLLCQTTRSMIKFYKGESWYLKWKKK